MPSPVMKSFALTGVLAFTSSFAMANEPVVVNPSITKNEVVAAHKEWCKALIDINATYDKDGQAAAKAMAEKFIDFAYAYQIGAVLFKPTLTVKPHTFRPTRQGALAYFVGGDPNFPNDKGFALQGWKKCEPVKNVIYINGTSAITIGKVHLTDKAGKVTSVDKTWGYIKDGAGKLRINLHHSSLEYQPK